MRGRNPAGPMEDRTIVLASDNHSRTYLTRAGPMGGPNAQEADR